MKIKISLIIGLFILSGIRSFGQEKRPTSLNFFVGTFEMSASERLNAAGIPRNIFGGYKPGFGFGGGYNYKLKDRLFFHQDLFLYRTYKSFYTINFNASRIGFKIYPVKETRKLSFYLRTSFNFNLLVLNQKEHIQEFYPTDTINTIGNYIGATRIVYQYEKLRVVVPQIGVGLGLGLNFRISPKTTLFADYSWNGYSGRKNSLLVQNFPYNKHNLKYSELNFGVKIDLFKPQKQLLARIAKEAWGKEELALLKGALIYQKPAKPFKKPLSIEITNTNDSTFHPLILSDNTGKFSYKNLAPGDYEFFLSRRNKRVDTADLKLIFRNRKPRIFDEFVAIELPEDMEPQNFISRDGNFDLVLREGFQHELDMSVTALSINGSISSEKGDTSCKHVQILLVEKSNPNNIRIISPDSNCNFNFSNIIPGMYNMIFRSRNNGESAKFRYAFTQSRPHIHRQFNKVRPPVMYQLTGLLSNMDSSGENLPVRVHLVNKQGKVELDTMIYQGQEFSFDSLPSPDYTVVYESKGETNSLNYTIKDNEFNYDKDFEYKNTGSEKQLNTADSVTSKIRVAGRISIKGDKYLYDQIKVYVVDSTNKVKNSIVPNKNGSFAVEGLTKGKYKLMYQLPDSSDYYADLIYDFAAEGEAIKITLPVKYKSVIKNKTKININKQKYLPDSNSTGYYYLIPEYPKNRYNIYRKIHRKTSITYVVFNPYVKEDIFYFADNS